MTGYWRDPEATTAAVRDGWMHTGDVGHLDADSYLYVVERIKDLMIRGGFNAYPRDVEDVLLSHSAVSAAAVVGRTRCTARRWSPMSQCAGPVTPEQLIAYCGERPQT